MVFDLLDFEQVYFELEDSYFELVGSYFLVFGSAFGLVLWYWDSVAL